MDRLSGSWAWAPEHKGWEKASEDLGRAPMRQAQIWMKSDIHMGAQEGTVHIMSSLYKDSQEKCCLHFRTGSSYGIFEEKKLLVFILQTQGIT